MKRQSNRQNKQTRNLSIELDPDAVRILICGYGVLQLARRSQHPASVSSFITACVTKPNKQNNIILITVFIYSVSIFVLIVVAMMADIAIN